MNKPKCDCVDGLIRCPWYGEEAESRDSRATCLIPGDAEMPDCLDDCYIPCPTCNPDVGGDVSIEPGETKRVVVNRQPLTGEAMDMVDVTNKGTGTIHCGSDAVPAHPDAPGDEPFYCSSCGGEADVPYVCGLCGEEVCAHCIVGHGPMMCPNCAHPDHDHADSDEGYPAVSPSCDDCKVCPRCESQDVKHVHGLHWHCNACGNGWQNACEEGDAPGDEDIKQNMDHIARILCAIDEERQRGTLKDATELLAAVDAYEDWMEPRLPEPHDADTAPVEDGTVPWEPDAPGGEGGGGDGRFDREKETRVKYQTIVYDIMNALDAPGAVRKGQGLTVDKVVQAVKDERAALAAERKRADGLQLAVDAASNVADTYLEKPSGGIWDKVFAIGVILERERERIRLAVVAAEHTCDVCSSDGGHDGWPRDYGLCMTCPTAAFRAALAEMDRGGDDGKD